LRRRCLNAGATCRWLALPGDAAPTTLTARMRRKIDLPEARRLYQRRLAIVEPVFANLRSNKRLDRFTYRGQEKVNLQWLLYCLVHNLEKLAHKSRTYGRKRPLSALVRFCHRPGHELRTLSGHFFTPMTYFCSYTYSLAG